MRGKRLLKLSRASAVAAALLSATGPVGMAQSVEATPRLRALDFSPFEDAMATFPAEIYAALDQVLPSSSVMDVQEALEAGDINSEMLVTYFLHRISVYDDRLRTYIELNPEALEDAREADRLRSDGTILGSLHGIPVSLKDNIETAGPMHTTAGAEVLFDNVASDDAELVTQLREAGAIILGKANLSEFAGSIAIGPMLGGTTAVAGQGMNPYGSYPTGGSSSGSAGGVASMLAMVSVGSETSGSLITPAAWNSVVGMKPSKGVVSGDGVIPLLTNNDSAGPIARSVTDAAVLLSVIDTAEHDYTADLAVNALDRVAVGVLASDLAVEDGNAELLQRIASILVLTGAEVKPAQMEGSDVAMADFSKFLAGGVRYDMLPYVAAVNPDVVSPQDLRDYNAADATRRIPFGQDILDIQAQVAESVTVDEFEALAVSLTATAKNLLDTAFEQSDAEVLVSIDNSHSMIYATAGYPAITLPLGARLRGGFAAQIGLDAEGMPVGVTLIGKQGEDGKLLAYAYAFEQVSHLRLQPMLDD
ncbi:amidase family protein [Pelagibacterium sp.]|uniref:amidase family protein n=1 Tax=Pelagibacterium sp. TaxID=1967288 RepID=UPI003A8FE068